jgi:hypothetical protein
MTWIPSLTPIFLARDRNRCSLPDAGHHYHKDNVEKSIRHAPLQERTLPNQGPSLAEHDG